MIYSNVYELRGSQVHSCQQYSTRRIVCIEKSTFNSKTIHYIQATTLMQILLICCSSNVSCALKQISTYLLDTILEHNYWILNFEHLKKVTLLTKASNIFQQDQNIEVIRSRRKTDLCNCQKMQTMINNTLHTKLKIR